jgi:hypothetical protein
METKNARAVCGTYQQISLTLYNRVAHTTLGVSREQKPKTNDVERCFVIGGGARKGGQNTEQEILGKRQQFHTMRQVRAAAIPRLF